MRRRGLGIITLGSLIACAGGGGSPDRDEPDAGTPRDARIEVLVEPDAAPPPPPDGAQPTCDVDVTFAYTGSAASFTVPPACASLRITADGAQGGTATTEGGLGAQLIGTVAVTPGESLTIQVGEQPVRNGGGGGTFVTRGDEPLIVAGGGGGGAGACCGDQVPGGPGLTSTTGAAAIGTCVQGVPNGIGGTGGDGGGAGSAWGAGGGGGLSGNGSDGDASDASAGLGGLSFANGGAGGNGASRGGFGGGGGASGTATWPDGAGGGGGGYSGGGGSCVGDSWGSGGGGGSLNTGTDQVNTAGARTGHGQVRISAG